MVYRNRILPTGGEQGPQGPPGADGADGSVWHWVTGTPAGSLGKVGDWATRTDTGATWQKTAASTWTSRGSLRGPQGVQSPQSATGATGAAGTRWYEGPDMPLGSLGQVGDFYHFSDGVVFEKTGPSTWESANLNLRGPKGDKGDTGATGPTGPTGPAGTITDASATTLPASSSATVTLGGTPSARTFAFGIPQGAKGEKGDQGPQGETGGAGVLGGAKFVHPLAQSIPHAQWTAIGSAGSSMTSIVPGTVSGSTGTAGFRMVVNSAGWWMVGASIGYGPNAGGSRYLRVETWTGTDPGAGNADAKIYVQKNTPGAGSYVITATTVVNLAANTNVRLCAYQNSGGSLSTNASFPTELWLTRVL